MQEPKFNSKMEKSISIDESTNSSINSSHAVKSANPIWVKAQKVSVLLDSFGAETRGLERVLPDERATNLTKTSLSVMGLWLAGCGGLTSMASFFLGPLVFELGFKDSMVCALVSLTLGSLFASYCALMGPRSGLRQMVGARFLFGYWFIKFVSLLLIIGLLGWSVTNCVLGGQILAAVSSGKVPIEVGIVIINIITFFVSVFGIKHVLSAETFLAIPVIIALLLLYVVSGDHLNQYKDSISIGDSLTAKGSYLSYFALCYSVTSTWGTLASDYYILFPENTSQLYLFSLTFFSILLPTIFGAVISVFIANIAMYDPIWSNSYAEGGLGGLLEQVFSRWNGGGKFLLMVLWLSLISNNIVNTYSGAFGIQLAGVKLDKAPRWLLAICITVITLICSLVGRDKFSVILGNFLPMLGYWFTMYFTMLVEENCIFRTKRFIHLFKHEFEDVTELGSWPYYNFEIWNDYKKMTHGIAATISFCIGVAGAVLGMAQVYFIGPIAAHFGDFGGDLGMWLSMSFVAVSYPVLRYLELKKFGR